MARDTRETWKKRIERWADSGLTAKEFAAEIGVNVHTLQHWKWRLAVEAPGGPPLEAPGAPPSFVEVVAPLVAQPPTPPAVVMPEPFELELPRGLRLRVPVHFDAAALCRLVSVLEAR